MYSSEIIFSRSHDEPPKPGFEKGESEVEEPTAGTERRSAAIYTAKGAHPTDMLAFNLDKAQRLRKYVHNPSNIRATQARDTTRKRAQQRRRTMNVFAFA